MTHISEEGGLVGICVRIISVICNSVSGMLSLLSVSMEKYIFQKFLNCL